MADGAASGEAGRRDKLAFRFFDLPPEVQHGIISQCSTPDLICIALVSTRFRELAAAHLYRNFHIVFPDDDDLNFDSPIDGLAGGLDTFTTSDYNYAQHLKDLSMDTLSAGFKGEQSYQSYLYSSSCGKFLNTLLHLTLRRSRCLQTFRWNIRVELSRPVYEQLHRIKTLKNLHLRMQAGESYYRAPPPLPSATASQQEIPSAHWTTAPPLSPPMPSTTIPLATSPPFTNGGTSSFWSSHKPPTRSRSAKRGADSKHPKTIAGFKDLRSLSVLDIDDTDLVDELRACIRNSSKLKELHLSFSDALAQQTRTTNLLNHDADDSDVEDDYAVHDHESSLNTTGPAKLFRAAEERKVQEAVLGRILGVDPVLLKKRNMPSISEPVPSLLRPDKGKEKDEGPQEDAKVAFLASLNKASKQLMSMQAGSSDLLAAQQEVLDLIAKASKKYVEAPETPAVPATRPVSAMDVAAERNRRDEESSAAVASSSSSVIKDGSSEADIAGPSAAFSTSASKKKSLGRDASAEAVDIEHIETIDDALPEEAEENTAGQSSPHLGLARSAVASPTRAQSPFIITSSSVSGTNTGSKISSLPLDATGKCVASPGDTVTVDRRLQELSIDDRDQQAILDEANKKLEVSSRTASPLKEEKSHVQAHARGSTPDANSSNEASAEYTRETRGLSLESLSIHLIPVKPSVLSRSINLHCLKQLTLLNVGNQAPIWSLLRKENAMQLLALRNVYTDHVSTQFVLCMSALSQLDELYMLQRSPKHRPESEAPPCNVTLDHIRRLILSKHILKMKRLMIKDESNSTEWDMNEKTMIMICTKGVKLEELAVSMNIHAVHAFMQYFSGLISLRALNILHFRNNDTCIWVMREIFRFIVDNLSHHPELKLEWIAMENDRVDRIIRPTANSDKSDHDSDSEAEEEREKKGKSGGSGNGVNKNKIFSDAHDSAYPIMPSIELDTDSDSDEDLHDSGQRLRFKTVGPLQFYDAWGVKIFEKEIRMGKL